MLKTPKLRFKDKNGNSYHEWSCKQFDEVFEILQNNTLSRKELNYSNKFVKNIHYGDVLINFPVNLNCQTCMIPNINQDIDLTKYKSSSYLQNGDVIFADTAEDETVGKACEICNIQEKILSGLHTIPCRPKFNFASQYLGYFLNSSLYHNQLLPLITGIKVSSISKSSIKTTMIYYPCFEEQEKIAGFLSKVDELINECEGEVKDLEEQKKGLLQKIFSQQIRFKDSDNNPYPDWEEKKLYDITDVRDGTHDSPKYVAYGYPLITSKNLTKDGKLDFSDVSYITEQDYKEINKRSKVHVGDILFGMIGTIGKPVVIQEDNFAIKNVALIKNNQNNINRYLVHYLQSDNILRQFHVEIAGGTQKFIALGLIRNLKIQIPCKEEQEKIAKVLSKMDELIEEKKALLSNWQQFKKGLLQQMFV